MLEKVMPNTWKIIQTWAQKGAKNHPKTYQKSVRKEGWKKEEMPEKPGGGFERQGEQLSKTEEHLTEE